MSDTKSEGGEFVRPASKAMDPRSNGAPLRSSHERSGMFFWILVWNRSEEPFISYVAIAEPLDHQPTFAVGGCRTRSSKTENKE